MRTDERGTGRDAVERALASLAPGGFLGGLDLVPLLEHLIGGLDTGLIAEHVRVAVHELVGDALRDRLDVERAFAPPDRGVKHDLHQ